MLQQELQELAHDGELHLARLSQMKNTLKPLWIGFNEKLEFLRKD
jgi:hypothetical protein